MSSQSSYRQPGEDWWDDVKRLFSPICEPTACSDVARDLDGIFQDSRKSPEPISKEVFPHRLGESYETPQANVSPQREWVALAATKESRSDALSDDQRRVELRGKQANLLSKMPYTEKENADSLLVPTFSGRSPPKVYAFRDLGTQVQPRQEVRVGYHGGAGPAGMVAERVSFTLTIDDAGHLVAVSRHTDLEPPSAPETGTEGAWSRRRLDWPEPLVPSEEVTLLEVVNAFVADHQSLPASPLDLAPYYT